MLTTLSTELLKPRTFSRRELIPLSADVLWLIDRGVVRTATWNDEGAMVTLGYWGAKDIVGQYLSRLSPYQIECLTSVEALPCPRSQWHLLTDSLVASAYQREELLNITRSGKVRQRLVYLRLTHQELAEAIGTTRVTITRLLKDFEREDGISRIRGHIVILPRFRKSFPA